MSKPIAIVIVALLLVATGCKSHQNTGLSPNVKYVASVERGKFHKPSCEWAKRIKSENLITFATREEAIQKGYIPCKVCRP